jgi:uncharacterized protein YdhG (YjbR/CyaY superfamily)
MTVENDVDVYMKDLPDDVRKTLQDLREAIMEAAPQADEVISYRIPTYRFKGPLVHFMAGKDHLSFITTSRAVLDAFREDLGDFNISGTTIHFSVEKSLPRDLVIGIVKARLEEIEKIP